jgi:hypothetical protein
MRRTPSRGFWPASAATLIAMIRPAPSCLAASSAHTHGTVSDRATALCGPAAAATAVPSTSDAAGMMSGLAVPEAATRAPSASGAPAPGADSTHHLGLESG